MARLLIDYSAGFSQGAGIGRYARNVVPRAVAALPDWPVTLLFASVHRSPEPFAREALEGISQPAGTVVRRIPVSRRRLDQLWFRARIRIPAEVFGGRGDVVYSPDFTAPPTLKRQPRLITVHDLAFLVAPQYAPPRLRSFLGNVVPREVQRATLVAVVSETTRRDVIERLDVAPERIVVVRSGVESRFFSAVPLSPQRRDELRLPANYLLAVGTLEPRKNHITLFRALRALESGVDLPLVVAGQLGWDYEEILRAARPLEAEGKVIRLDYVPEADLPGLYAGAAALVYPSWYEGFGLPVLEAMAAGVPVVTSDAPALVEVGGGQTFTAPPGSADAIAAAIERAMATDARSEHAATRRIERARAFSWDASGEDLATALRRLGEVLP